MTSILIIRLPSYDVTSGNVLWEGVPEGCNSVAISGLGFGKTSVGAGWAVPFLWLQKKRVDPLTS